MYDTRFALDCTVYASALSPCKQYLAVANNYGYLSIFNLGHALKENLNESKPLKTFLANNGEIYCLETVNKHLVSAGVGGINIWSWKSLLTDKPGKKANLSRSLVDSAGPCKTNDVNCIAVTGSLIISGCDENSIDIWDVSTEKCVSTLSGHKDYIHSVVSGNTNDVISASEDGSVKMWDIRTKTVTYTLEPHKEKSLVRPENGKWLSCVAIDDNNEWIVCGGGPKMSLWHARSWNLVTPMESENFTPNVCKFYKDMIITGGNQSNLFYYNVNGSLRSKIPCSMGNVFSFCFDKSYTENVSPLIATGSSFKIDIFNNPQYKTLSLWQV